MNQIRHNILLPNAELVAAAPRLASKLGLTCDVLLDAAEAGEVQAREADRLNANARPGDPEKDPDLFRRHAEAVVGMGGGVLRLTTSDPEALSQFNQQYRDLLRRVAKD